MIVRAIRCLALAALLSALSLGAPRAQYSYGSYGSETEPGFILLLEAQLANPRNVDNVVATELVGSTVTPLIPVWDDELGGRVGVGWRWASGNSLMLTAWGFQAEQSLATTGNLAFAIGPPIVTGAGDGFIGDRGNSVSVATEIDATSIDLAWVREHELSEGFALEWSLGLRYAQYEETHAGIYGDGAFVFGAAKALEGEAIGARAALRGSYRLGGAFSISGGLGLSALDATITAASSLTPTPASFSASSSAFEDDSRSGTIRDLDVAVSWHLASESVRVSLGWEQAEWGDLVADPLRDFPGTVVPRETRDEVVFSGLKLGVRFVF